MNEKTINKLQTHKKRIRPAHIIVAGFLAVIFVGSILLCLPISSKSRTATNYLNALFTATSAVCVTGLTVVDTATHFSFFGQAVLLLLIQIGGLGFMSLTTMFMILLRRKITLKDRLLIKEALNQESNNGLVRLARNMLLVTFGIEGAGFLLLLFPFVSRNGGIGVWQAFFCAVSAFCNAGFDVLSVAGAEFMSLGSFAGNVVVNLSISVLIILGGLGFAVIMDIGRHKGNVKKLSLHSKIVLLSTAVLIVVGWLFFFLAEFTNKATIGSFTVGDRILAALFQSVTTRTAGFATVPQGALCPASKMGTMILMFVGASPGSTG
ncbi:MAG: Trk family potassium uptake protein, partial [Clostridiales bacterium]|nr:Trk family potassium uptake protein [Clostridiales bacterium]